MKRLLSSKATKRFIAILALVRCAAADEPFHVDECTLGVVSGRVTSDGRPLLWKVRDGLHSQSRVQRFQNNNICYIGVVDGNSARFTFPKPESDSQPEMMWMGVNSDGFAIMNAHADDLIMGQKGPKAGELIVQALATCSTINDFERILQESANQRRTADSFGVIDACGGAAIFEVGENSYSRLDATDSAVAPEGFLVRSGFTIMGGGNQGSKQFKRAIELCSAAAKRNILDYKHVLTTVVRDVSVERSTSGVSADPEEETDSIDTSNCINRWCSVAATICRGVRAKENPQLSTFWVMLGQPMFTVAVPLWVRSTRVPKELGGEQYSPLCCLSMEITNANYTDTDPIRGEAIPRLKLDRLQKIQALRDQIENEILKKTDAVYKEWLSAFPAPDQVSQVQENLSRHAMRELLNIRMNTLTERERKIPRKLLYEEMK